MGKALDIDLYKKGFDARYIDCIHGPVAAAAGHFKYDNYFYYCFLHSITGNMENYFQKDIYDYSNQILRTMGLKLERIFCSEYTEDEVVSRIMGEIQAGRPVILVVKYNALFYNMYYKNDSFTTNHGIIINEFNENNQTFGLKETTLLRDSIDAYENRDVFFTLHITYDMLKTILKDSNEQFYKENNSFLKRIYSLKKTREADLNNNKVIQEAIPILENNVNNILEVLSAFNGDKTFSANIQVNRLRYFGCLKPIFVFLYQHCDQMNLDKTEVEKTEEQLKEIRDKVLNALNKASLKGETISEDRKLDLCNLVKDGDQRLLRLIKGLIVDESNRKRTNYLINIKNYYNNQAFEENLTDNSTADITGEGTHYIMQDVVTNTVWNKDKYCFYYSYDTGRYDNISCDGQEIALENIDANHISILGCSEFGNFNEEVIIEYSDNDRCTITADFSDFFQPPVFMEHVYWAGPAAVRKNGKTIYHSFNSRLFAKDYQIKQGKISKLILPKRRNVHIFAVTLYREEWI